jgi:hypothetical protein
MRQISFSDATNVFYLLTAAVGAFSGFPLVTSVGLAVAWVGIFAFSLRAHVLETEGAWDWDVAFTLGAIVSLCCAAAVEAGVTQWVWVLYPATVAESRWTEPPTTLAVAALAVVAIVAGSLVAGWWIVLPLLLFVASALLRLRQQGGDDSIRHALWHIGGALAGMLYILIL